MDEILKLFGGAENLWAAIQENANQVGVEATKTMLELFYVLKSPDTSMLNKSLDLLALLAGSVLVELDLFLRSNKGIIPELQQAVTGGLLAIGRNTRNEPLSLGFGVAGDARGVASDCHWRRNGRGDNFLRHRCVVVTFFAKVGKNVE